MKLFTSAAFAACLAMPAWAQSNCAPTEQVMSVLQDKYEEAPVMRGITNGGALLHVFANPETGTWSVTVTLPGGITCLADSGTDFALSRLVTGEAL